MLRTVCSYLLRPLAALVFTASILSSAVQARDTTMLAIISADGNRHDLDADKIAALPQHTLDTHTAWTEGVQHFDGVLLRDVLAVAGIKADNAKDKVLEALALNDFRVEIPATDAFQYDVLLAQKINGKALSRRDKGPFWIIYPRDQHAELNDSRYDHRWAWQLKQLQIK